MILDHQSIAQVENCTVICNAEMSEDDNSEVLLPSPGTPTATGLLPSKTSEGKQVHRLQKSIEEAVGQCKTSAFLTNDIPTLETALQQSKQSWKPYLSEQLPLWDSKHPQYFMQM